MSEHWGPFVLRERIGVGAFGSVYRAYDPAAGGDVAIKLYAGRELPAEPRLLARVKHPNVVAARGAAVHGGRPGLCLELVRGRTLGDRVAGEGPLPPAEVVRIGLALCGALSAVHASGLVHQDVKAQNVMEERGGRIVLLDLGSALAVDDAGGTVSSGTPFYMAPEVLLHGARPSRGTDLYSLGVLLFHLLTGTYPVCASTLEELRDLHEWQRQASPRRFVTALRDLNPDVSLGLARGVAQALAPAEKRYATADDLAAALVAVHSPLWGAMRRLRAVAALGL